MNTILLERQDPVAFAEYLKKKKELARNRAKLKKQNNSSKNAI